MHLPGCCKRSSSCARDNECEEDPIPPTALRKKAAPSFSNFSTNKCANLWGRVRVSV